MKKLIMVIILGLAIIGGFVFFKGNNLNAQEGNVISNGTDINAKLDQILENQFLILQRLDNMQTNLDKIRIRTSVR